MTHFVYLLTGSNEGDRKARLHAAVDALNKHAGNVVLQSRIYETAAWGMEGLPPHLNQALLLCTEHAPEELLRLIQEIENQEGRTRQQRWGMRSLDIDIIYYDNLVLDTKLLIIPHPMMQQRRFVLEPLASIAAKKKHPVLNLTTQELLTACTDLLPVQVFEEV